MTSAILRLGAVTVVATVFAVAGCATGTGSQGGPMMGDPTGYQYSRLTCPAPTNLPGRVVTVTLADMGMSQMMGGTAQLGAPMVLRAAPAAARSGVVSFIAENAGWRTHELIVLPLSSGSGAGRRVPESDGVVDETGSLGEASGNCAPGHGDGIPSGSIGWVTMTLLPGRYELLCNLPNHYADGMYEQFVITA